VDGPAHHQPPAVRPVHRGLRRALGRRLGANQGSPVGNGARGFEMNKLLRIIEAFGAVDAADIRTHSYL